MPSLLVFDSSGERLAAALVRWDAASAWPGQPRTEHRHDGPGGAQASAALVPVLQSLLDRAGLRWPDLDAVGFGCGPGAFTGVRTACAVAQGLAFGAGKRVLPLDTLEAVAHDAWQRASAAGTLAGRRSLWVAQDARMNEIYAARYAFDDEGRSQALEPPALYAVAALQARWRDEPPEWIAGSALGAFGSALALDAGHAGAAVLDGLAAPGAAALAALACQRFAVDVLVEPSAARPLYLRDKVALTTLEREALRTASPAAEAPLAR